jgi:hypothetical protein
MTAIRKQIEERWVQRRDRLLGHRSLIRRRLIHRTRCTLALPEDQRIDAFIGDPNDGRLNVALDMLDQVDTELEYLDGAPEFASDGHLSGFRDGAIGRLRRLSSTELLQMLQAREAA